MGDHRSPCAINLTLEVLGDKWSLLIIRDMMFGNRRHFRDLMKADEGIASNILADRLKMLVEQGIVTKRDDPSHAQKALYSLTERGIALLPLLAQMAAWGKVHLPVSKEMDLRARALAEGGPKVWAAFMDELRRTHLGPAPQLDSSVGAMLQSRYEALLKERSAKARRRPRRSLVKR